MGRSGAHICLDFARVVGAAALAGVFLAGCASPLWTEGGPPVREVVADWGDVDAAVELAVRRVEMGLLEGHSTPEGRRYSIRTEGDEPVELTVRRLDAGAADPQPLRIEARVGRFGNPQREGQLAGAVARRLSQLRGVDHAPVD